MNPTRHLPFLVAVLAALAPSLPQALGEPSPPPSLPPASSRAGVTFDKDIHAIFQENCLRCHGEERAKGGIRLDTLAAVLAGGHDGKIIVPGNSAQSSLVLAVARVNERSAMPPLRKLHPGGPPAAAPASQARALSADEVGLIRAWIDQGAH